MENNNNNNNKWLLKHYYSLNFIKLIPASLQVNVFLGTQSDDKWVPSSSLVYDDALGPLNMCAQCVCVCVCVCVCFLH
jgi:hypothetical protein